MQENQGWIKLWRKIKNKGWYKNSKYVHLWVQLLLMANHKKNEFMWNNQIIIIKEGQLVTGRKQLSDETGIAESTIEKILKLFEKEHQIEQQKTTKYRLITVLNWKDYQLEEQQKEQQSNNRVTTKEQQTDTNKNVKKEENVKNDKKNIANETFADNINPLIKLFEAVNPTYERLFSNRTQRAALERLVKKFGEPKTRTMIEVLPQIINKPYAPKITTPLELERDLGKLKAFYEQEKGRGNTRVIKV